MMKDETWFTAKEAQDQGFIDTVLDAGEPVKAQFDLSVFAHAPEAIKMQKEPGDPPDKLDKRTLEHALRDVGLSQRDAKAVIARGFAAIDEEEARVQARETAERLLQIIGKA
jgi:hypothetical protein